MQTAIKKLIEKNPLAFATITLAGNPNIIGIAYVKVVEKDKLLISDIYMHQTIEDIKNNPHVALVVWNKNLKGYKFIGTAQYFNRGKYFQKVKSLPENKNLPVKGAIVVKIEKVIKSA